MGLLNKNTNAIYLSVADGKIVRQFKTPTADTKERITKTGKVVHEEFYDNVEGHIVAIDTKENEYGKFWLITIENQGEKAILQFQYSGGTASAFLKTLPNVDLTKPVKISPKQEVVDGKKKSSLFLNQGGNALKWFWTKDNPGDLPQLRKIKVKGKETWDDSDMMEYLEGFVNENIIPQLKGAAHPSAEPAAFEPVDTVDF